MNLKDDHPAFPVPGSDDSNDNGKNAAADLIRGKLDSIYKNEPDAVDETIEVVNELAKDRSVHQAKMYELATSGKPLAQVQTEWHEYYVALSNKEKHEVWKEFYEANSHRSSYPAAKVTGEQISGTPDPNALLISQPFEQPVEVKAEKPKSVADIKKQLHTKVSNRNKAKLSRKQHLQSLGFGLGVGGFVVLLLLFGFFNERFIAPFITPSRQVSATPLIVSDGGPVGPETKVIIPKINVEVPVVYDVPTIDEPAVEAGLERGVVHYATTPNPGEKGNSVIFGHSSNNILNKGKYKFAFVLLSRLENGDTFYLQKDGKRYVYRVFDKKVVKPEQVDVLYPIEGKVATATLITCDPPGTSINRKVIVGEQISPDPNANTESTALQTDQKPKILASNSESLWHRIWSWVF